MSGSKPDEGRLKLVPGLIVAKTDHLPEPFFVFDLIAFLGRGFVLPSDADAAVVHGLGRQVKRVAESSSIQGRDGDGLRGLGDLFRTRIAIVGGKLEAERFPAEVLSEYHIRGDVRGGNEEKVLR